MHLVGLAGKAQQQSSLVGSNDNCKMRPATKVADYRTVQTVASQVTHAQVRTSYLERNDLHEYLTGQLGPVERTILRRKFYFVNPGKCWP